MQQLQHHQGTGSAKRLSRMIPGLFMALALIPMTGCGGSGEETGHGDEHGEEHESGEPVELSKTQVAAAGIEFTTVGPGLVETRLSLPAVIEPDRDATSHVTPKVSGVVRSVHARLGQRVEKGQLLCVIDSVELGMIVADYRRVRALAEVAQEQLASETELFAKRLEAQEKGYAGQVEVRRAILERETELREKQVSTVRPLLEAERALREVELARGVARTELESERDARLLSLAAGVKESAIEVRSAAERLAALGIKGAAVEELLATPDVYPGSFSIRSEADGVVVSRSLSVGKYVEVGEELFEIQDLSRVWVMASVFEDSLRHVKSGQQAKVTFHAFPGEVFVGKALLLDTTLDSESRSLALRIELANSGIESWGEALPFRPGMFGDVSLVIESHQGELTVPESAIVHEVDSDAVFIRTSEGHFEKRVVRVLGGDTDLVEVISVGAGSEPLQAGDEVAISGTLVLKSLDHADELVGHDD